MSQIQNLISNREKRIRPSQKRTLTPQAQIFPRDIEQDYLKAMLELIDYVENQASRMGFISQVKEQNRQLKIIRGDAPIDVVTSDVSVMEESFFSEYSDEIFLGMAVGIAGRLLSRNRNLVSKQLSSATGQDPIFTDNNTKELTDMFVVNNVRLIKSVPARLFSQLTSVLQNGFQQGLESNEIADQLEKQIGIAKNDAARIARDQVATLNGQLTKVRQQSVGIDMYKWKTANDERVRGKSGGKYPNAIPSHWSMNNVLCRWDNNSVYSVDGGKTWIPRTGKMPMTIPGAPINCRCYAEPFFDNIKT